MGYGAGGIGMHRFKGEYGENECIVKIAEKDESYMKNPFILLNLEEFFKLQKINSSSHCDFLFVYYKEYVHKYILILVDTAL